MAVAKRKMYDWFSEDRGAWSDAACIWTINGTQHSNQRERHLNICLMKVKTVICVCSRLCFCVVLIIGEVWRARSEDSFASVNA